jgi:anti-anti-sigma regulatory factor
MAVSIHCNARGGLAAAMELVRQVRAAWDSGEDLLLDLSEVIAPDIAIVQTIEVARAQAGAEGRSILLAQPASSAMAEVLEQSGLLWAAVPADRQFWFHKGEDA